MLYFRCYNCWSALKFEQKEGINFIKCLVCGVVLYVGKESFGKVAEEKTFINSEAHQEILEVLLDNLRALNDIVEGNVETIAGSDSRHEPDAIFYAIDDKKQKYPFIYEVETCERINRPHSISQCKLFGQTALNTGGNFYFVVPKTCEGEEGEEFDGEEIAKEVVDNNNIRYDGIITY